MLIQVHEGSEHGLGAGNVVIFLITVIGLLGYTSNEANRRRKELAIPSVVAGLIAAWLTVD